MTAGRAVVAYVPVLHEGYRRLMEEHARGGRLYVVGEELYADDRPLAKDIRRLEPGLVAAAIDAWGICASVAVLDAAGAERLAAEGCELVLPAEDVSYRLVERWFPRSPVLYASAFLRWDRTRTVQMLDPAPVRRVAADEALADLVEAAELEAARSIDWWRQVGAALRLADGRVLTAHNEHNPHPLSAYAAGDPRSNFSRGVHFELTTATHAEARLIGGAAREGAATAGGVMYVTDFPCPPCAKLIAAAGVERLLYRAGYAVVDGRDVLDSAGVEILQVV